MHTLNLDQMKISGKEDARREARRGVRAREMGKKRSEVKGGGRDEKTCKDTTVAPHVTGLREGWLYELDDGMLESKTTFWAGFPT